MFTGQVITGQHAQDKGSLDILTGQMLTGQVPPRPYAHTLPPPTHANIGRARAKGGTRKQTNKSAETETTLLTLSE